jgi:orotidine-5'-phosphate decarboxylase
MTGRYFELLDWLKQQNKKIFADLKFFDVPATVASSVKQLNHKGIEFATVHGNDSILKAAAEAKDDVKILAVTVLTSLDRGDMDDLGFDCNVEELVLSRAKRALQNGCDGVISSGLEVTKLRASVDEKLIVVTPGIRPVENRPEDDQKRVVSVQQAFEYGTDYIVIGRPIRNAENPRQKAEFIQQQITEVFS